jgi:maltokinase
VTPVALDAGRRQALARAVAAWAPLHGGPAGLDPEGIALHQVEVLVPGRPGLLDVVAEVGGRPAHCVLGLRRPGEEVHLLGAGEEAVLGLYEADDGLAVVVDGLADTELSATLLQVVDGGERPEGVGGLSDDEHGTVLAFPERAVLTVFCWPLPGPHPGVALLHTLDEAGFNHLAAPLALWRREGLDLGLVQEYLAGPAPGFALALTSLRDLYAAGGAPEEAGADFGPEARALGTMTARMHLSLDRAVGRNAVPLAAVVAGLAAELGDDLPPELAELADDERAVVELPTHGDFTLARTARTDVGWVVADVLTGGRPPGSAEPARRSPLADVADLLWSLHRATAVAGAEREPGGRAAVEELGRAWEGRNRRAFLGGYLGTPGIGGLVPSDRDLLGRLVAGFELLRARRAGP